MLREIIKPKENNFTINIPNSYLNRKIEFIMFPIDEKEDISNIKKDNISILGGSLKKYANSSKIDLESKAWEMHIMDKYK